MMEHFSAFSYFTAMTQMVIMTTMMQNGIATELFTQFISSMLSHWSPAKKARQVKAAIHNLYYHINDLNTKKLQPSGDLNHRQHAIQACAMGATH